MHLIRNCLLLSVLLLSLRSRADNAPTSPAPEVPGSSDTSAQVAKGQQKPPPTESPTPAPGTAESATPVPVPLIPGGIPYITSEATPLKIPFTYGFHGFIRTGYMFVPYSPSSSPYVGRDSGFVLYNSRLEFSGAYSHWFDFDLSVDNYPVFNATTGQVPFNINFADAYVTGYLSYLYLRLGQFKTPFNGEFLLDEEYIQFGRLSVLTTGTNFDETIFQTTGILLDRALGGMLGTRIPFGEKNHFDAQFAAVNGSGINMARNDNNSIAVVGRLAVTAGPVTVAGATFYNPYTNGILATLETEDRLAGDFDILVDAENLHLGDMTGVLKFFAMGVLQQTKYITTGAPTNLARGLTGSLSLAMDTRWIRIEPAVRATYYLPSSVQPDTDMYDETIGLNIGPRQFPMRLQINETFRQQDKMYAINNDMTEVIVQADF